MRLAREAETKKFPDFAKYQCHPQKMYKNLFARYVITES